MTTRSTAVAWAVCLHTLGTATTANANPVSPCSLYAYHMWDADEADGGTLLKCDDPTYTAPQAPVFNSAQAGDPDFQAFPLTGCRDGTPGCTADEDLSLCLNGTHPFMYVSPAKTADPESTNKWLFWLQGGLTVGGTDNPDIVDDDGNPMWFNTWDAPDSKYDTNPRDYGSNGGQWNSATQIVDVVTLHPEYAHQEGIRSAEAHNPFRDYHRVQIQKCTPDRWMGNSQTVHYPDKVVFNAGPKVTLYHHGRRIIDSALNALDGADGPVTWQDLQPDSGQPSSVPLPDLSDADEIVFVGSSAGGLGLIQIADSLRADLSTLAPNAQVKFVLDSTAINFPALEGHVSDPSTIDVWDNKTEKQTLMSCDVPVGISSSASAFQIGGYYRNLLRHFGNQNTANQKILDASCALHHAVDLSPCYSAQHVLFHHLDADVMSFQSRADSALTTSAGQTQAFEFRVDTNGDTVVDLGDDPASWDEQGWSIDVAPHTFDCSGEFGARTTTYHEVLLDESSLAIHNDEGEDRTFSGSDKQIGAFVADSDVHELLKSDYPYRNGCVSTLGGEELQMWKTLQNWLSGSSFRDVVIGSSDTAYTQNAAGQDWATSACSDYTPSP